MDAAILSEREVMRALALALLMTLPAAAARAEPVQEARSATSACLSAVIDNAPVEDINGDDVDIRRGKDPVSCTVRVRNGQPVVVRDAVMTAIKRRPELFTPAKSRWEPAAYASRETFCNIPGRRALTVVVSTARPGGQPVLTATVFEAPKRDARCDKDLGVQQVAEKDQPAAPATAAAAVPPPTVIAAQPARKAKKRSFLSHIPGLGGRN
jgi:hypothetical protein